MAATKKMPSARNNDVLEFVKNSQSNVVSFIQTSQDAANYLRNNVQIEGVRVFVQTYATSNRYGDSFLKTVAVQLYDEISAYEFRGVVPKWGLTDDVPQDIMDI